MSRTEAAPQTEIAMPLIRIEGIRKAFPSPGGGEPVVVFENIWCNVDQGEFVCLIGHSGCGKTTLLNILAGLDMPSEGTVIVGTDAIEGPSVDRAVVFQGHALMPWMTAFDNIAFAVRSKWPRWSKTQVREQTLKYIELVRLAGSENHKPAQLSGGMKQRVGIARALAIEPKTMLLDEPFSALDALTRGKLQDELLQICAKTHQTVFMITHDIDEAILLADRIVLMTNGPHAHICEIVENALPRDRTRHDMHYHEHYYPLRNHLIEFLVNRSARFEEEISASSYDHRHPPVVRPMASRAAESVRKPPEERTAPVLAAL